jgi:hypothetical protein
VISLKDYLTASGKYPERESQATTEVIENAKELLKRVNNLLADLGVKNVSISSGFRPAQANAAIGGAKKSHHMTGKAIDIAGDELDKVIMAKPEMLKKYNLWLEHPDATKGWTHLDMGERSSRPVNIFKP